MNINQSDFTIMAKAFGAHFDSVYYVDTATDEFCELTPSKVLLDFEIPKEGSDFFKISRGNAAKYVHPNDLDTVLRCHEKEYILAELETKHSITVPCRLMQGNTVTHIRHVFITCGDDRHIICAIENAEEEFAANEKQNQELRSAERMARLDELTGIKNQNAFSEYTTELDNDIKSGKVNFPFGVVMCDLNNLKHINDTRGHSFGDEAIQRACRLICGVYDHSPVFRVGGDEFVVILKDDDYEIREKLLMKLKGESYANGLSRTGPVVAVGMAEFNKDYDKFFADVFNRADQLMYENKTEIKSGNIIGAFKSMHKNDTPIPVERKRILDGMFGAMITIAEDQYVYLNDMRYDYSRWSLPLVDDFGLESEYMYHADQIWREYVHPDDLEKYEVAVEAVLTDTAQLMPINYRAKNTEGKYVLLRTRGFVLTDSAGVPEYFGGIIVKV